MNDFNHDEMNPTPEQNSGALGNIFPKEEIKEPISTASAPIASSVPEPAPMAAASVSSSMDIPVAGKVHEYSPPLYRKTGVEQGESVSQTQGNQEMDNKFYAEKIRSEGKKKPSKFKQYMAIACVASILGGTFFGLSVGVGFPLVNNYLIPSLKDDRKEVEAFSFTDPTNASALVAVGEDGQVLSYAGVVDKVEPSVVNIVSTKEGVQQFFNFSVPGQQVGAGTGILFYETSSNYYIATNAHVIDGASEVSVSIKGSEGIPAKPVGKNVEADLAVISIDKAEAAKAGVDRVVLASFGDSDAMKVGDGVLAIGNALGEGNTATNGIVSAKDKEINIEGIKLKVLQTNAAINPGNSGGPLVNLKGEIIGINTAKINQAVTAAEGTGYAIPSNVAKPIIEELVKGTPTSKPVIGVKVNTISAEDAEKYSLPMAGAIIEEVFDGFPAAEAGLIATDIITSVDNNPVLSREQLVEALSHYKVGDTVTLKVLRSGKDLIEIQVKLAEGATSKF